MLTGSLCSGYLGLDLAVHEVLGGELAWVADNDPDKSAILAHHFPGVPNLGDISETDWSAVEPVDVLTAGFPCTDISCAGRRAGLRKGNRSGVWHFVARAIAELRPPLVVIENVKELLSERADSDMEPCPWCLGDTDPESAMRALGAVLADLAQIGFDAEWVSVPAAGAGACHLRWRVFILAWPAADTDRTACGERGQPAPGQAESGRSRADAGRPGGAPAPADTGGAGLEVRAVEPDRDERPAAERGRGDAAADTERLGRPGQVDGASPATRSLTKSSQPASRRTTDATGNRSGIAWGSYEPAIHRWETVLGRPAPRPTEPGRTGERLSPAFVEWMQGLPEGWVTDVPGLSRNAQLKALGNGVVVQQCALALRLLLARTEAQEAA